MSYRLLLDENIEYRIVHKLRNYEHDAEHVSDLSTFGKGSTDKELGQYSNQTTG
jgi:predicted nuclease of predicted toxin-antitoxin system